MQKPPIQSKPPYPLESVDNALRLLQLIRDEGSVRIKQAAAELGVAQSTAHRLLAMLVFRGFAMQDDSRAYVPGPSLGVGPAGLHWTRELRQHAEPHMQRLSDRTGETVNLMIRVGVVIRFLATIEGPGALRVGDRQGAVLPASQASGGKALLATLDDQVLHRLYRREGASAFRGESMTADEFTQFMRQVELIRLNGYSINAQETETGVAAIGVALHGASGRPIGAMSVATPASRFRELMRGDLVAQVCRARELIERELAEAGIDIGDVMAHNP